MTSSTSYEVPTSIWSAGLQKVNEIIMFGGECVDPLSGKVRVFNDLYRFNCDKEKWTRVLAPGWYDSTAVKGLHTITMIVYMNV